MKDNKTENIIAEYFAYQENCFKLPDEKQIKAFEIVPENLKTEHKRSSKIRYMPMVAACLAIIVGIVTVVAVVLNGDSTPYKRISFDSQTLGETLSAHIDENTKVVYKANDSFPSELAVYKISKHKIAKSDFDLMMENLGLTENSDLFKLDGNTVSGALVGSTDPSRGYFNMSDDELEKIAWDTFNKLPFMEGSYEYLGIKSTLTEYYANADHVVRVGVSFRRKIDDLSIIGNDRCYLYFDGSGLVEINVELYDYEKINTINMITLETASERIKTPDSLSIVPESVAMIDTLQVDEVRLLYVNHYKKGCEILQPVYDFTGVAKDVNGKESEFSSLVIAIPDTYTN